jgi:hypothetical protein
MGSLSGHALIEDEVLQKIDFIVARNRKYACGETSIDSEIRHCGKLIIRLFYPILFLRSIELSSQSTETIKS